MLESPQLDDSNEYRKHIFYEEIRTKQDLSYTQVCPLSLLYNSKFILMAMSWGTNFVVGTSVLCINLPWLELPMSRTNFYVVPKKFEP